MPLTKVTPAMTSKAGTKGWIRFNGSGTVAILDSYNVDSITDVSTGVYDVNWLVNMADTNYGYSLMVGDTANVKNAFTNPNNIAVGSIRISSYSTAWAVSDAAYLFVSAYGEQ